MLRVSAMAKKDTGQFNLRPPRELVNRLAALAVEFRRDAPTQIAVEILQEYTELWAEAEQAKRDAIERQQSAMRRAIKQEMLKLPLHKAATETGKKEETRRKTST